MAGERSIQSSAFVSALTYLKVGISMLEPRELFSSEHYDISLRLYSSTAEAELVNGNMGEVEAAVAVVSKHASCLLDRIPSLVSLMKSYMAQGKLTDTISTGLDALEKLGVSFPQSVGTLTIIRDMIKTKMKLRGKTDEQLRQLSIMKDESKIATMGLLRLLFSSCYVARPDLLPLVTFRMVRLSVKHGLSHSSALAFAMYGFVESAIMGNFQEGYRFGKLALSFLEKFENKEIHCQVVWTFWGLIAPWGEQSLIDTLEHVKYSYKLGMEVGDQTNALAGFLFSALNGFFSGQSLALTLGEMDSFVQRAVSFDDEFNAHVMVIYQQCVLNLMGRSDNPVVLQGTAMNEDDHLEKVAPDKVEFISNIMSFIRLILAHTFCDYKVAIEVANKSRVTFAKALPGFFGLVLHVFFDGLAACALARESNKSSRKHKKAIKVAIKKMKCWATNSPSNCKHKLLLLKAEYCAVRGKESSACKAYDAALDAANKSGMMQDEALAYERAAVFFRELGDEAKASRYLAIAHQLYLDWGADAKSSQLQTEYSTIVSQARKRHSFQDFMIRRAASIGPSLSPD